MANDDSVRPQMGNYRSHLRRLDILADLAGQEAERLGSSVIGPDEFLLAILHPDAGNSRAAQALRECGVTREAVDGLIRLHGIDEGLPGWQQYNPAGMNLQAMAEGLAAGLGSLDVDAEHVLLAYLWEPTFSAWQLEHLGTSREQVLDRLAEAGAQVPQHELPTPDPRRYGPDVDVPLEQLGVLLEELWYVIPRGADFAWNHDGRKAWIALTEGLDAEEYIQRALQRHELDNFPRADNS